MTRTKVGILISGRGSNMEALIAAAQAPDYPGEIALVLSNNPAAGGLEVAQAARVATAVVDHRPFGKDRAAHEQAVDAVLRATGVEIVALAGYMRVLTPFLVEAWAGAMINIHPSLLPAFPGLQTHSRALESGAKVHGCTVHLVTAGVDEGPILGQSSIDILPGETEQSLAARVLIKEHELFPHCLSELIRTKQAEP